MTQIVRRPPEPTDPITDGSKAVMEFTTGAGSIKHIGFDPEKSANMSASLGAQLGQSLNPDKYGPDYDIPSDAD